MSGPAKGSITKAASCATLFINSLPNLLAISWGYPITT